jgi:HD-GYP domain-containing protein (c-di-GMP phosphodiesterase class II)
MWRSLTSRVALAGVVIAILFAALVVVFLDANDAASQSERTRTQAGRVLAAVDQARGQMLVTSASAQAGPVFDRLQATVRDRQQAAAARVSGDARRARRIAYIALGAALLLVIATVLAVARGARALDRSKDLLEQRVAERTGELERSRVETLERLARAAEWRDDATHQHAERIGRTAALLGQELGLDDEICERLRRAAPLHDVGKISTPDAILLKPGRLTPDEVTIMRNHAAAGAQILSGSESRVLQLAEVIARSHHERWDGTGYPAKLAGEDIPLAGRIVAVADVFDALTHARPYKGAWPIDQAVAEVRRCAGSHFDPAVVAAFERLDHRALVHATPGAPQLVQVA